MTYRAVGNRHYPYNTGLLLGSEVDIVITNENSEPLDAEDFIKGNIGVQESGGNEEQDGAGENSFKAINGMVRMYSMMSYCRAYSTDNIWWMMKNLVINLKKKAFISYVPSLKIDDIGNEKLVVAAGHMKFSIKDNYYDTGPNGELKKMTYEHNDESHTRLVDNIRVVIGLISLLLDRRESAEHRRKEYGPFSDKEFRKTTSALTYQTPTNFWLFSPMLSHLMFGAGRWAYYMTQNNFEHEIWEGFESGDIKNAIHNSDYETGMEIWRLMRSRMEEAGYKNDANPFGKISNSILEMLFDKGMSAIGSGVYKNWRMSRQASAFRGHFIDLPSWENGAPNKVFTEDHPMHATLTKYYAERKNNVR